MLPLIIEMSFLSHVLIDLIRRTFLCFFFLSIIVIYANYVLYIITNFIYPPIYQIVKYIYIYISYHKI